MWLELLQNNLFLAPLAAFVAGLVTFFASCLLPLVPIYIAYLSGIGATLPPVDRSGNWLTRLLNRFRDNNLSLSIMSAFFVLGFIATFVVLGAMVNRFALIWGPYRLLLQKLGGVFFVIMGLFLAGFFQKSFLQKELRLHLEKPFTKFRRLNAFITGVIFAFGWTPCIGPILAVILFWAGRSETFLQGIFLLLSFGLGLGLPFLLLGIAYEEIMPLLTRWKKAGEYLRIGSGVIIFIAGLLLISNRWSMIAMNLLHWFRLQTLTL